MGWVKNMLQNWLEISKEDNSVAITIKQNENFESSCAINRVWLRGDSYELEQLYKQLPHRETTFWGSIPSAGMKMKKSHTGLPKRIVKVLAEIVMDSYNGTDFKDQDWKAIEEDEDFDFEEFIETAIIDAIGINDGAARICYDPTITDKPIIEWFSGDKVEFVYKRKRLIEIIFKTFYTQNTKRYLLKERYGKGYIKYELYDDDKKVNLSTIEELSKLRDLTFDKKTMWAVPLIVDKSFKYEGRGESKLEGKHDAFDSLDEVVSQWIEAVRTGRAKTYIPENLLPKNPKTGEPLLPNPYDNQFIETESDMKEGSSNKIQVEQPDIPSDKLLQTYITYLEMALQGLVSPSTLGIDTKKIQDPNASYERQMEKTTMNTRQSIIDALSKFIPRLINTTLQSMDQMADKPPRAKASINVKFGEFDTPSFDSQIDSISKAKNGGIMSLQTSIDELYGDSKDEKWKKEELARLKEEQGITMMDEPSINDDVDFNDIDTKYGIEHDGSNFGKTKIKKGETTTINVKKEK